MQESHARFSSKNEQWFLHNFTRINLSILDNNSRPQKILIVMLNSSVHVRSRD